MNKDLLIGKEITRIETEKNENTELVTKIILILDDGSEFIVSSENLEYFILGNISKECDYCGERSDKLRPSPFMADIGADMCRDCWNMTRETYINSTDEDIGNLKIIHISRRVRK